MYTGIGSIALYLSQHCSRVVGVETVPEAIEDAKENAAFNNIENADFVVGDVKDMLNPDFVLKYGSPDVIITDPPRAGMHKEVVETLLSISCPKLVYISCNPATQARDLELLSSKYETVKLQPVDMFPHTSHIETVALLKLKIMSDINKFLQLEEEIKPFKKMLLQATNIVLDQDVTKYPIFVFHQQQLEIGIPISSADDNKLNWSVHISSLEEFVSKNIVYPDKIEEFKGSYKDPLEHHCLFVVSELGTQFLFMPVVAE